MMHENHCTKEHGMWVCACVSMRERERACDANLYRYSSTVHGHDAACSGNTVGRIFFFFGNRDPYMSRGIRSADRLKNKL